MIEAAIAVSAAILVVIQAHRNWLMIEARSKENRTADALEKIHELMAKDAHLKEIDRKYSRKATYR